MKARLFLGLCALLAFPGCFDPIVGTQCAKGFSRCGNKCVVIGSCAQGDAGTDAQGLEAGGFDGLLAPDTLGSDTPDESESLPDAKESDTEGSIDAGFDSDTSGLGAGDTGGDGSLDDVPVSPQDSGEHGEVQPSDVAEDVPVVPPDAVLDSLPAYDVSVNADGVDGGYDVLPSPDSDSGADVPPLALDAVDANQADGLRATDAEGSDSQDALGEEASPLVCEGELAICDNQCFDLKTDPGHCGGCTTVCETGICNDGTCFTCPEAVPTWCGMSCTNTDLDADNCGACGNYCGTGICSNGHCEAAGTGRLVVIGHDYTVPRQHKNRILYNAVFLWPNSPVRVLAYSEFATAAGITGVKAALEPYGGRPYLLTQTTAAAVPSALQNGEADVLLVYAQANASNETLNQLGIDWGNALFNFVNNGGTVVILDADQVGNAGTVQILSSACQNNPSACLLQVSRQASVPGSSTLCNVVAGGDALAASVAKSYMCQNYTTTFTLGESGSKVTSVVEATVGDAGSAPVVISKVF